VVGAYVEETVIQAHWAKRTPANVHWLRVGMWS
jgi:hypothetical protein